MGDPSFGERLSAADEPGRNRSDAPTLADVLRRRITRRGYLRGVLAASGLAAGLARVAGWPARVEAASPLGFQEIRNVPGPTHRVAPGYDARVLIRWGDPVLPGASAFDPAHLTAAAQQRQFGYNCDFTAYFPLPAPGSRDSGHGLLVVNHEYTDRAMMWAEDPGDAAATPIEQAAHGVSVIEVRRGPDGAWEVVPDSRYARRITVNTPMEIAGPAAGDPLLRTSGDPAGRRVLGTVNNCAGGKTPWGTALIAEENFHFYFMDSGDTPTDRAAQRYGVPAGLYGWGRVDPRFDLAREPRESHRFGWVWEFDPYDPASVPRKRTALGRMKHEGGECVLSHDGRVAVYMGDDERGEYIYKYVSAGAYNPDDRARNATLLDHGTLYVARFRSDGTGRWRPLAFGADGLGVGDGFQSMADVLVNTRAAADRLRATPMDRPEDIAVSPETGKIYVSLTNNRNRTPAEADGANPRPGNLWGHIVEIVPPADADGRRDHTALDFDWEMLLLAGNPADPAQGALYHPATSPDGWFTDPDNLAFDNHGRLWVATDGGPSHGIPDGVRALQVEGERRALPRFFFACPQDAELCGPEFTPDGETLFVSVQHPGDSGTFRKPTTRWPDFAPDTPPRPAVVAITRKGGGEIGG